MPLMSHGGIEVYFFCPLTFIHKYSFWCSFLTKTQCIQYFSPFLNPLLALSKNGIKNRMTKHLSFFCRGYSEVLYLCLFSFCWFPIISVFLRRWKSFGFYRSKFRYQLAALDEYKCVFRLMVCRDVP